MFLRRLHTKHTDTTTKPRTTTPPTTPPIIAPKGGVITVEENESISVSTRQRIYLNFEKMDVEILQPASTNISFSVVEVVGSDKSPSNANNAK